MESSPLSPCLLLDTPPPPNCGSSEVAYDGMVPSYILRVLMEDDIDDKLSSHYSDHPALQQMQLTFAQIVYTPSSGANNNRIDKVDVEGSNNMLQGASGDQSTGTLVFSKGADEVVSLLKGAEGASDGLLRDNDITKGDLVNEAFPEHTNRRGSKKRFNSSEHLEDEEGRSSKAVVRRELEETGTPDNLLGTEDFLAIPMRIKPFSMKFLHDSFEISAVQTGPEMFAHLMMNGYEVFVSSIQRLRRAMADEARKNRRGASNAAGYVVDLHTLLNRCAQAVDARDYSSAHELLEQIKRHASAKGDASQRLAQYFVKGLEARLVGMGSRLLMAAERPSVMEYFKAINQYMAACSFNKVALTFNVSVIEHVMKGKNRLHVVDFGLHHGFHWAYLLRVLALRKPGPPPAVKITAIACSQLRSFPAEWFEETGRTLGVCARAFGLPFEFHVVTARSEDVRIEDLKTDADEVLVVNEVFNFSTLMDESVYFDDPSPRDTVLRNIRRMRPDLFIQGVVNCSYGTAFLTRFRDALFYYSSMFDVLDATMPRDTEQRLVLERELLGPCVLNVIACEGRDRMDRSNTYKQWQLRNQRAGLRQLPLVQEAVSAVKKMVKEYYYSKDFVVDEDHRWLLQGWKGRILYAHSTWVADDAFPSN